MSPRALHRRGAAVALSAILLGLVSSLAGAQATGQSGSAVVKPRTTYEDLQMFSGVLNQIRVNHPDSVDSHDLIMAAIEGMVRRADPHSYLVQSVRLSPEKEKAWRAGKLYPVPIDFAFWSGAPVVISVYPGTSAARADILPGDELVGIDGKPVLAENAFELDVTLAGEKGSTVTLTLERRRVDGTLVQLQRQVKREKVGETTAVPTAFMLDPQTGYVRVTTFANTKVADDLHDVLGRLEKAGMKRLVLDMRDNGGGSVDEAASVAGEFLPKGTLVFTSEGRKKAMTDTGRVSRSFFSREKRYPVVAMLNAGSASATELVAGALQDHDRALIVGRPSFGKSLVMTAFLLPDGSMLEMVVGHLKTPCGRVIQRTYQGISRRDYYRLARAERDTVGRPSCRTDGGRTVYGGGGIYPDILFPEATPQPLWLARVEEELLPFKWVGGWVSANGASLGSLDAFAAKPELPAAALADFRSYAGNQGVTIPSGADADRALNDLLAEWVASAKWGDEGKYRVSAVVDPEVKRATEAFGKAAEILGKN